MQTKFAPPERAEQSTVLADHKHFQQNAYIHEILNSLPYIAAILNEKRQVVYSNEVLLEGLGFKSIECLLGKRPGELVNCIHAFEEEGGCGTSESCKVCGAGLTIMKSIQTGNKASSECRIRINGNEGEESLVFHITAKPFKWQYKDFLIITLNDISHEKQRRSLERIFFHDVINMAGSLNGFLELLQENYEDESTKFMIDTAVSLNKDLLEEILAQRELTAAENNDLSVKLSTVNSLNLIENLSRKISQHAVAKNRHVFVENHSAEMNFTTDPTLLKRVLINMLKNALEATKPDFKVSIGCYLKDENIVFYVTNPTYMTRNVQLQIFQRSFSTKGEGRGLGTYSIKLLSEKYLGGKVWFRTDLRKGTRFFVALPVQK